jgi:hypothetical protein
MVVESFWTDYFIIVGLGIGMGWPERLLQG